MERTVNYFIVFVLVGAVFVISVVVSYVADRIIHPAPPTQTILPEPVRTFAPNPHDHISSSSGSSRSDDEFSEGEAEKANSDWLYQRNEEGMQRQQEIDASSGADLRFSRRSSIVVQTQSKDKAESGSMVPPESNSARVAFEDEEPVRIDMYS